MNVFTKSTYDNDNIFTNKRSKNIIYSTKYMSKKYNYIKLLLGVKLENFG